MSYDADFISPQNHKKITEVMHELGFKSSGKDFRHPDTNFFVEFPSGTLAVGSQFIKATTEMDFHGNKLILLSPTQSVMDRLAAFFIGMIFNAWIKHFGLLRNIPLILKR